MTVKTNQSISQKRLCSELTQYLINRITLVMCFVAVFSLACGKIFADDFGDIQSAAQQNQDAQNLSITAKPGTQLPLSAVFTDSEGHQVHLGDYFHKGRPVILDFIYFRCPGVCPYVQQSVATDINKMPGVIGKDYEVVSISFDPTDTPAAAAEKKASYVAQCNDKQDVAAHWHVLTGNQKNITAAVTAAGFHYIFYPAFGQYNHPAGIFVCTPDGRVSNVFEGLEYDPTNLNLALVQAGDDRITNVFDQILLFCCSYDPQTGKYTPIALRVMALSGVAVVIGLASIIGSLFYWEYKHRGRGSLGTQA
ncbi:MAG TPA: SCO family protein [Phycisphaerae bacterium]|nr:SCO family protein [Phycisphaerae bacterium]